MARLESESKAGFYPTPPKEMELIIKRLSSQGNCVTLLDPCAGEGLPLRQVQDHLYEQGIDSITYGIELEKTRAKTAELHLDNTLNCGYEETRLSHRAFSFMYLNPPFSSFKGERLERIFFRDLTKPNSYLTDEAVVVLNMPQRVLEDMSSIVAQRLENVKIYRFTDENFYNYRQVILYGTLRKKRGSRDENIKRMLEQFAYLPPNVIPTLETEDDVVYNIPKAEREVSIFETNVVDIDDVIRSMEQSRIMESFIDNVSNPKLESVNATNPAMPLKISHMATAIASGALPEEMGDHLLVGVTKVKKTEDTEYDDEGTKRDTETFQSESMIRVFTSNGIYDLE